MYTRLISESTDPAFNLALEEYLLCGKSEKQPDLLMLWRSRPSVIIGKFQNAYEEVSLTECRKSNVPIYRRNSGGGTVYHDLGNINFSFFTSRSDELPDYPRFLTPVVDFLRSLGIPAEIGGSLDITVCGKKVSGNAQSVHGGRMMHHGTLLFDCNLTALNALTGHIREKIVSKSIKSNPSAVSNVKPYITGADRASYSAEEFIRDFASYFCKDGRTLSLTSEEADEIRHIADAKYRTWEWNFGRSPAFTLKTADITLEAKNGVIQKSDVMSDILCGERLIPDILSQKISAEYGRTAAEKTVSRIFD